MSQGFCPADSKKVLLIWQSSSVPCWCSEPFWIQPTICKRASFQQPSANNRFRISKEKHLMQILNAAPSLLLYESVKPYDTVSPLVSILSLSMILSGHQGLNFSDHKENREFLCLTPFGKQLECRQQSIPNRAAKVPKNIPFGKGNFILIELFQGQMLILIFSVSLF